MTLGEKIKKARKMEGLTITKLGEMIGATQGHLSNIESDKRLPSIPIIKKIAIALNISYFDLMVCAGHFDAEEADREESVYTSSIDSEEQMNKYLKKLHNQVVKNIGDLELSTFLSVETGIVKLDGIELTDEQKERLLNVARAMFI